MNSGPVMLLDGDLIPVHAGAKGLSSATALLPAICGETGDEATVH